MSSRAPELIRDLTDKTADLLQRHGGITSEKAQEIAHLLADELRSHWGGSLIYFPKGEGIDLGRRDMEFYERWNGTKEHLERLALEYGFSIQWAYKIVKEIRRQDLLKRQGSMF